MVYSSSQLCHSLSIVAAEAAAAAAASAGEASADDGDGIAFRESARAAAGLGEVLAGLCRANERKSSGRPRAEENFAENDASAEDRPAQRRAASASKLRWMAVRE